LLQVYVVLTEQNASSDYGDSARFRAITAMTAIHHALFSSCSGSFTPFAIIGSRAAPISPASLPSSARVMIVLLRPGNASS
jgi:hypothetical protein